MNTTTLSSRPLDALPLPESPAFVPEAAVSRKGKRLLLAVLVFIFASVLLVVSIFAYAAYLLTHPKVAALSLNPMSAKNLPYSDVSFPSADGASQVHGWWIPGGSERTVVLSHGFGANREEPWVPMYDIAELLNGWNYNVLMFDYGFADPVRPSAATGGIAESQQLLGALQFARSQGSAELVVWGFSMGAGTALQAALQTDLIDGMILDSTFLADEDTIYENINRYVSLPRPLTLNLVRLLFPLWSGYSVDQIPSEQAQSTDYPFPIMLVYGTADDKSPQWMTENIAAAQSHPSSELWIVPDVLHEMIFRTHTEEYVERASVFLDGISRSSGTGETGPGETFAV